MPLDPLAPFEKGVLHRINVAIADIFTDVPGKSICRHIVAPFVRRGANEDRAVVGLHWLFAVGAAALVVGGIQRARRR